MSKIDVLMYERDLTASGPIRTDGLRFEVVNYSWHALGGPEQAEIKVYGDPTTLWYLTNRLRAPVHLLNQYGELVWWGYLAEISIVAGTWQFGVSLDNMYNRLAATYTEEELEGGARTGDTIVDLDVSDNADSQTAYGIRTLLLDLQDTYDAFAVQDRCDSVLSQTKYPVPVVTRLDAPVPQDSATLRCRGWWGTMGWQLCSNLTGRVWNLEGGGGSQKIGWGIVSSTTIGFLAKHKRIDDTLARLGVLEKDDKIKITGSASNNGAFTVVQGSNVEKWTYVATTISFAAGTKTIADSAKGTSEINANDLIVVTGSTSNDGTYRVESTTLDGASVVVVEALADEAAGDTVTIVRGQHILVNEAIVDEAAGASVSITGYGQDVGQQFDPGANWTAKGARVKVRKVGAPADALHISLREDSAGVPGTQLCYGTLAAVHVYADYDWATVKFTTTTALTMGTPYWLVVARVGANDDDTYYELDVDTGLRFDYVHPCKVGDGAAWQTSVVPFNLIFEVADQEQTTTTISNLIAASKAQFIPSVTITDASASYRNQYQDGTRTVQDVIEELLAIGSYTGNRRLLAKIDSLRAMTVYLEPAGTTEEYYLDTDGKVVTTDMQPLRHGIAPVAIWVYLRDLIGMTVNMALLINPSPIFIERAEYDVSRDRWILEPRARLSPWDIV